MTKKRHIGVGDYVEFANREWIVLGKEHKRVKLLRRRLCEDSPPIWVRKKKVKLKDQSWRRELGRGDPVAFFISGTWTPASVVSRHGSKIRIQPSFTNYSELVDENSHSIDFFLHSHPLWSEQKIQDVFHLGQLRTERGDGLMFPWDYEEVPVSPAPVEDPELIKTLSFKLSEIKPGRIPFRLYDRMTAEEIVYDVRHTAVDQHPLFGKLLHQFVNCRALKYPMLSVDSLNVFIDVALAHEDHTRVDELLSIGSNHQIFQNNEWAVLQRVSHPFFDLKMKVEGDKLLVDLLWRKRAYERRYPMPTTVKEILTEISTPLNYAPRILEADGAPEQSYLVSRMLGMEMEPLEKLYLRRVSSARWLTVQGGFCDPSYNHFGGVVDTYGCDIKRIVLDIVTRRPLKTLVVVHPSVISDWNDCSLWYGNARDKAGQVVVTTKNVFTRSWSELVGFKRLVCCVVPSRGSAFGFALRRITCSTRWTILNSPSPADRLKAFAVLNLPYHEKAIISLQRQRMEEMGVLFPIVTHEKVRFEPLDYKHVLANTQHMTVNKRVEYISRYLLHTSLVPKHLRGIKLDVCEATLDNICDKFKLKKSQLEGQLADKCAVCYEKITDAMVTPCGHVFCPSCTKELQRRKSNCPMCRKNIDGYVKVSEKTTRGEILMHQGICYKVDDQDRWGTKILYLRQHPDATIVTQYNTVKSKLQKELPNNIITLTALKNAAKLHSSHIIFLEPMTLGMQRYFQHAWGRDLVVTSLSYKINI